MGGEWKPTTIGEHFDLVNGFAFKSADFLPRGVPVIKIKNVKAGYFSEHVFSYVDPIFLKTRKDKLAKTGDLLISMSGNRHDGSPSTWVGKVAYFDKPEPFLINQRVGALRLKLESQMHRRFMAYLLSSWSFQELFISIATSSGGQANISPRQILGAPFKAPSPTEQRAIAHILGTLDDKIELNRQMNLTLEKMAQAIFKSWFIDFDPVVWNAVQAGNPIPQPFAETAARYRAHQTAGHPGLPKEIVDLFPDRFEESELGLIPEGWEVKPVGDVIELAYGKSLPKKNRVYGQFPVYGSGGVTGFHDEYFVQGPGVVVGRKGTVGSTYWEERNFFPIDTVFYVKIKTLLPLYWVFLRLSIMDIEKLGADSAVPGVNRNSVYAQKWIVPGDQIVKEYQAMSDGFLKQVEENRKQIDDLSRTRDTLLPELISGALPIPDAETILGGVE